MRLGRASGGLAAFCSSAKHSQGLGQEEMIEHLMSFYQRRLLHRKRTQEVQLFSGPL